MSNPGSLSFLAAARRVFRVGDHKINFACGPHLANDPCESRAAGKTDDVTDDQYFHKLTIAWDRLGFQSPRSKV